MSYGNDCINRDGTATTETKAAAILLGAAVLIPIINSQMHFVMQKHKIAIILGLCLLVTLAHVYKLKHAERKLYNDEMIVVIDDEEAPGIGAGNEAPDTCLIYVDNADKQLHIKHMGSEGEFHTYVTKQQTYGEDSIHLLTH